MDKVFIEGLEVDALIGIYDWERRIRQPLAFDIEMAFDNRVPAASDARNVVMSEPQTKIEVPKTGAITRLPAISRPIRAAPERKTTV